MPVVSAKRDVGRCGDARLCRRCVQRDQYHSDGGGDRGGRGSPGAGDRPDVGDADEVSPSRSDRGRLPGTGRAGPDPRLPASGSLHRRRTLQALRRLGLHEHHVRRLEAGLRRERARHARGGRVLPWTRATSPSRANWEPSPAWRIRCGSRRPRPSCATRPGRWSLSSGAVWTCSLPRSARPTAST